MKRGVKERIEKEAEVHASDQPYEVQAKISYIAGSKAERKRIKLKLAKTSVKKDPTLGYDGDCPLYD
jgi:hypothetical protein